MADNTVQNNNVETVLTVCATTSNKLVDLAIKDGQLIYCQDKAIIAFDYKSKRNFYSSILEIDSEAERKTMTNVRKGYYFVLETAVLWAYQNTWVQLTTPPSESIIFVGTEERPEIGAPRTLYVSIDEGNENISTWNETKQEYTIVADKTHTVDLSDIDAMFA